MADFEKASQKAKEFRHREEEILRCALELFLEKGEDRVTVEMIADRVGIGKGTIYKHFESKNEIYLRLMIRYEEELAKVFGDLNETDDKDKLAREYFRFRMEDPVRYALFDRLEAKCVAENAHPELLDKLHEIRDANLAKLEAIITARITEGKLEDVPAYFHICSAWALVHGAVALYHSDFFKQRIEDKDEFFSFLMDLGVRMGNRGQVVRKDDEPDTEGEANNESPTG